MLYHPLRLQLGGGLHLYILPNLVQKLRRQIGPIGPFDGVCVSIDIRLFEEYGIFQRLKDLTVEFVFQVYVFDCAIVELQPQLVVLQIRDL